MDRIVFSRKQKVEQILSYDDAERDREISSYDGPDLISRLPDEVLGVIVNLSDCSFPSGSGCGTLVFPCLNHLSLRYVDVAEELLQRMISNSPGIESLALHDNSGHRRLRLSLPRLRYLAVSVSPIPSDGALTDLVVEDAASLERLLLNAMDDTGPSVRIIGARNLKMIGYLATGFPIVSLNDQTIFKCMVPVSVSLVERFSTVKVLALLMPELPKLEVVVAYLRCFPCLEKLKIKFYCHGSWKKMTSPEDYVHCDPSVPVECLDRSLKIIVLQS